VSLLKSEHRGNRRQGIRIERALESAQGHFLIKASGHDSSTKGDASALGMPKGGEGGEETPGKGFSGGGNIARARNSVWG